MPCFEARTHREGETLHRPAGPLPFSVMDPPERPNGTIQGQDASDTDLPMPLRVDPQLTHYYQVFPENDEEHLYECTWSGLRSATEPRPPPPGHLRAGTTDHHNPNGPPRVPGPPLPPRTRLPGACLQGGQGRLPPPVPPRTRVPLGNLTRQFSCDLAEPARKLNHSRTETENHVSV